MNHYRRFAKAINRVAVIALLAGAATAEAGDVKIFPATMCRQIGTTSSVYYDGDGRLANPSTTSAVTVICPIVRDHRYAKWNSVQVVVADRNPTSNVTCVARSNQTDGLGWSTAPTNPLPAGLFRANWWESDTLNFAPQNDVRTNGTYFLRCTIPPRYVSGSLTYDSGIDSYRIDEAWEF